MQHFVPLFSSELAGHIHNPGGLGLDDLSLTRGEYERALGTWWIPVGQVSVGAHGWTSRPQAGAQESAAGVHRLCLWGRCQLEKLTAGMWLV